MVRIGNILIDPKSIDTILLDSRPNVPDRERGIHNIQLIYKSGVVKNITSQQVGMSYIDFINEFEKVVKRDEDTKLLRLMATINQKN